MDEGHISYSAIGTTGNGKLSIDEYIGHNLENADKSKTVGGSVGISTTGISSIGLDYSDRKQEGVTKNTVIGNVEIGKSSGAEINKDLGSMTEVTKDRKFETNVNIESQTIKYALNPEAFKQDLKKAKNEIEDIGNVIENTVNPPGEDKRNFFKNLRAQRWNTSFYNVTGSRMEELSRQFKAGEIDENQLKEAVRKLAKGYGKDIGIEYEVVYLDEKTMPKDSKGSTGAAYKAENGKILIPIDVSKIEDINQLLGTLTEEISHGKDALEGRQDKKVAEDKSNDEEGLESLGRPANDYVKNKLGDDNNSKIKLSTDGIDLSNADVGEKVGDVAITLPVAVGAVVVAGLMLPEENKEAIKKVTMQVYEDIKEGFNKFGNNIKVSYVVVKALIEEKLKEKGIEADVKIVEDKNGNVSYIVYPLDKGDKRDSKLDNSSGSNISKASSSNNSDENSEKKEENINKDNKGPNNNKPTESNLPPDKNHEKEMTTTELDNSVGSNIDLVYENGKKVFNNFNLEDAYVKTKHLATTGGNGAKFLGETKAEAEVLLKETITNGRIVSIIDNGLTRQGNSSYAFFIDAGKTIGTKGENIVKIILSSDGGMISAYPVR